MAISSHEYDQEYEMMCFCWPGISSCFFLSEEPASQCAGDRQPWWDVQKSAAGERKILEAKVTLQDPLWEPSQPEIQELSVTMNASVMSMMLEEETYCWM